MLGLALHNLVLALLWGAGVRGAALDAIAAWKEILLVVALARAAAGALGRRRLPFRPGPVDWLALAFAAVVVLYAVLPQGALDGQAGARSVLYGLRHYLVPVAAYLLGRSLELRAAQLRRLVWTLLAAAAAVAGGGLVDQYAVPIEWWRGSGAVGYFRDQLGLEYHGPAGLPENFVFNTDEGLFRRLVSSFLSPLGAAYMMVVALLFAASQGPLGRRARTAAGLSLAAAGGLLFTVSRASVVALAAGLLVLALARRRAWPVAAAAATLAAGVGVAFAFPSVGPRTHFFPEDMANQIEHARRFGGLPRGTATSLSEPSLRSHWTQLRDGLETLGNHPQGYGLGNAGTSAARTGVPLKAGESNYTEIGVETGIIGLVLFLAWSLGLAASLVRAARRLAHEPLGWAVGATAAALAAVLVLAVQTDALGVPWLAYCLWALAGALAPPAAARSRAPVPAAAVERA